MNPQGFTLIELLIVLLIVGLGWFTLLPRLDMSDSSRQDSLYPVNELLRKAADEAAATNTLQRVHLAPGRDLLQWGELEARLPASLSRAEINKEQARGSGREASFLIYPAGHMDEVALVLVNGQHLRASPLDPRLRTE
ncbi:prepilin-type N-terminal cleavage/methylation domain-containing protein [Desulfonatronospira sp.]|uniref:prepilin-type N-terminal cleavage/methylation domain-containing protein n=1 Tax=Desulfonatronospira sp. TaxID=1962951 RepID=UPI0025BCB1E9|nr:prepilin-type N-terminal cleavage/methylation domain-containing protein [Desulfonatronospira sp.]